MKTALKKALRTCKNGHQYYKSNDCPSCPACEAAQKPKDGFLALLSAPLRCALEKAGIRSLKQLSTYSANGKSKLHGVGKTFIPILRRELKMQDLDLKTEKETLPVTWVLPTIEPVGSSLRKKYL